MTRRDYCGQCSEMVPDCAVCCNQCGKSFCGPKCAVALDASSQCALVLANIKNGESCLTTPEECARFSKCLQDPEVQTRLFEDEVLYAHIESIVDDMKEMRNQLINILLQLDTPNNIDSKVLCGQIEELFCCVDLPRFTCRMCHLGIWVDYKGNL